MRIVILTISFICFILACKTKPPISNSVIFQKVKFIVLVDGSPCQDCGIEVLSRVITLDEFGMGSLDVNISKMNSYVDVRVFSQLIQDSEFENFNVELLEKNVIKLSARKLSRENEKRRIQEDLENIKSLVLSIRERIKRFQDAYPNSNISEFYESVEVLESDVEFLNSSFAEMERVFANLEGEVDIHDLYELNKQNAKIAEIRKNVNQIASNALILDSVESKNETLSKKSYDLESDVFFELGMYTLDEDSQDVINNLDKFYDELLIVKRNIEKEFSIDSLGMIETYGKIKITGYTDGMKFNNNSCDSLFQICKKEYEQTNGEIYVDQLEDGRDSCNMCLSYLRAKNLGYAIQKNINIFDSEIGLKVATKGSILAIDGNPNSALRKCEIAFIVNFEALRKSN